MTTPQYSLSVLSPLKRVFLASTVAISIAGAGAIGANFMHASQANAELVSVPTQQMQIPSFANVVDAVSPAVVSVRVEAKLQRVNAKGEFNQNHNFGDKRDFFRKFFDDQNQRMGGGFGLRRGREAGRTDRPRRFGQSQGSGFFVSSDGYIVTNNHVVDGGTKFTVLTNDGTELEATLVGVDAKTDLAVLKVSAEKEFTYVEFNETPARVGDWVVAVGNPFGLGGTVTAGIVSANGREIAKHQYDDFIQIDAAVNKGNSGGPTFNLNGKVIGVNTAIFSPSGGNVGIAFAVPAKTVKTIVGDLIDNGQVVRGWLGVRIQSVGKDIAASLGLKNTKGAIVADPQADSPAEKAGIHSGDIITAVDGEAIIGSKELARIISSFDPNSDVKISIWRDGKSMDLNVILGTLASPKTTAPETKTTLTKLGKLGMELKDVPDGAGVLIAELDPQGSAALKGLKEGDVITSVNGSDVTRPKDVLTMVEKANKLGRRAALFLVKRGDISTFVAIPTQKG